MDPLRGCQGSCLGNVGVDQLDLVPHEVVKGQTEQDRCIAHDTTYGQYYQIWCQRPPLHLVGVLVKPYRCSTTRCQVAPNWDAKYHHCCDTTIPMQEQQRKLGGRERGCKPRVVGPESQYTCMQSQNLQGSISLEHNILYPLYGKCLDASMDRDFMYT